MKTIITPALISILCIMAISSCKKKKDDTPSPSGSGSDYCVKRTFKDSNENNIHNGSTELFKYNGSELTFYNSDIHRSGYISTREKVEYAYENGLLKTMVVYSNNGQSKTYTNYKHSNGKIIGYTTIVTGLYPDDDGYPKGSYFYNSNGSIKAYVEESSSTSKDSTSFTVNASGKINYCIEYHNGVKTKEQTDFTFDGNGNQTSVRYKGYNSSGTLTYDDKVSYTFSNNKNPIFNNLDYLLVYGYNPIYNHTPYLILTYEYEDMLTNTVDTQERQTHTFDDQNRVKRSRVETYDKATSTWKFRYDYEYAYDCN